MARRFLLMLLFITSSVCFSQEQTLEEVTASPNPFIHHTKITFKSSLNTSFEFTVKNILGKTIFRKTINAAKGMNNLLFYKDNLVSGIYIYTLQNSNNFVSKRLVIQ